MNNTRNNKRELYRNYQRNIFLQCLEDAKEISTSDINIDSFHLALSFFEKRCKPLYYYLKYGNGYHNH